jgi:hypothetical protein
LKQPQKRPLFDESRLALPTQTAIFKIRDVALGDSQGIGYSEEHCFNW